MPASCYILYSKNLNKFYVGATGQPVELRLQKHNNHGYGGHRYTATTNDWEVFLVIDAMDYAHAIRMERKIKSMKSKAFIQNLKNYPELRQKTIDTTSTWLFR
jgi:putative endonuclease